MGKSTKNVSFVQPIKIKRIIQSYEEIGKMNNNVPLFMAKTSENFIAALLNQLSEKNPDETNFNEKNLMSLIEQDQRLYFATHLIQKYTKVKKNEKPPKSSTKKPRAPKKTLKKDS